MNTAIGAEFRGVEGAGATEAGEQGEKAYAPVWWLRTGTERELLAYLAADKTEQEDK